MKIFSVMIKKKWKYYHSQVKLMRLLQGREIHKSVLILFQLSDGFHHFDSMTWKS